MNILGQCITVSELRFRAGKMCKYGQDVRQALETCLGLLQALVDI